MNTIPPTATNAPNTGYYQPNFQRTHPQAPQMRGQVYDEHNFRYPQNTAGPVATPNAARPTENAERLVPVGGQRPAITDLSPSKTETSESMGTPGVEEVELNSNGGLCRLFWYMTLRDGRVIAENAEKQGSIDHMTSCVLRWTFFPMIFQTVFLVFVAKFCFDGFPADDQIHDGWTRIVAVFAIAMHIWSMTNFFFNDLLRQHQILNGSVRIMACDSKLIAWVLFTWEIIIFVALIVLGSCFIAKSESPLDAILDCLALEFILGIDNYVAEFQSVTGGIQTAHVPSKTVLPSSNKEWSGCSKIWVCLALNLIVTPIVPLAIGWGTCLLMDRGLVEIHDHHIPVDAIIFGVLFFLMIVTSRSCVAILCCGCRKAHDFDSYNSSSEDLYTIKGVARNGNAQL